MVPARPTAMIGLLREQACSVLLDLIMLPSGSDRDKDGELLRLRQHLRLLQRTHPRAPRSSRWEHLTLLLLVGKRTALTNSARARLGEVVLLCKPETLLKWQRELVRRQWTFRQGVPRGRPSISPELNALSFQRAKENPPWGYGKRQGEPGATP